MLDSRTPLAPALLLALGALVPATAAAAGEACFRDTECAGAELCVDGVCSTADPSVQACTDVDDCDDEDVCLAGFCKFEGVACRNVAGACWLEGDAGRCECGDGNGSQWTDGFNPDDPPEPQTDPELQTECAAVLVDTCGDTPPALPDSCTGQVLEDCEAFVEQEHAMAVLCGEDVPSSNIARTGECCEQYDDPSFTDYRECLVAIDLGPGCPADAWDQCESSADGGAVDEQDGAEDSDDAEKAGCRTASGSPWAVLALFGLSAALRRTRRR